MRCPKALEWISVRVDGRSPSGIESRRLDEHLARCPSCRHVLSVETERAALLDLALRAEGEECDLLVSRIVEAARHPSEVWRQRWDSRRFSLLAPLAVSAALGLVLGAGGFWWWLQGLSTMGGAGSEVAGRKPVAGEGALPVGALEEFQVVSEEELWDAELEPEGSGRGIRWSTKTIELDPAVYEKKVPRGDRAARLYLELERIDNFRLERTDNFRFARLEYR